MCRECSHLGPRGARGYAAPPTVKLFAHSANDGVRLLTAAALGCSFTLLLTSCGSDAHSTPPAVDERWAEPSLSAPSEERFLSRAELAERLADVLCNALASCCGEQGLGGIAADCRAAYQAEYERELADVSALAVAYDPFRAGACIANAAARLQGCSYQGLRAHLTACVNAFVGTRGIGEECTEDLECARQQGKEVYCASRHSSPNTCQLSLGPDEPCALEGCQAGLFCDLSTLTCQPQRASGDCSLQIDACSQDSACSPAFVCAPKLGAGEACQLSLQCESGACGADSRCVDSFADASYCSP